MVTLAELSLAFQLRLIGFLGFSWIFFEVILDMISCDQLGLIKFDFFGSFLECF